MNETDVKTQQEKLIKASRVVPIIQTFGMALHYNDNDEAVWTLPFNKGLTNSMTVHGGAIATLIDTAGWFTVAPHFKNWIATVEFSTRLLDFEENSELIATGQIIKLGKRITTTCMEVVSTTSGKKIAIGSGTYSVTSVPYPS